MDRKTLMHRVNSIAHQRAREAYRAQKAEILQAVRQAAALGEDVGVLLRDLEREGLRADLLGDFKGKLQRRASTIGTSGPAAMPVKESAVQRAHKAKGR